MKKSISLLQLIVATASLSFTTLSAHQEKGKPVVVGALVADIRTALYAEQPQGRDDERLTQVLFGEKLLAFEEKEGWLHVQAIEQPVLKNGSAVGVEGWIHESEVVDNTRFPPANLVVKSTNAHLINVENNGSDILTTIPIGSYLRGEEDRAGYWTLQLPNGDLAYIEESNVATLTKMHTLSSMELRESLVDTALSLVGTPYLAAGRSPSHQFSGLGERGGVDASGFINLLFRVHGRNIPRYVDDQYKRATHLKEPERGDLVFLGSSDGKMSHVMMVASDNCLLEASGLVNEVQKVKSKERLGRPIHRYHNGDEVDTMPGYHIYFASFISK